MAKGQVVVLSSPRARQTAYALIERAPHGAVLSVAEAARTNDQNAKLWAMLSEIARAKPEGRVLPTEKWKALFMDAAGFKVDWEPGLNGGVVPCGYRSSRLTKAEFSDLIECIHEFAARHGIELEADNDN
jgi:hypothetical protein